MQERILGLIKPKLELLALLVLTLLAGDRNGPGMPIHPNILLVIPTLSILLIVPDPGIPLIVQMVNLMMKRKTMLNSLSVKYPM